MRILNTVILFVISLSCYSQDLHIVGSARIEEMAIDNQANNIVIQKSDGTLGVREATTLTNVNFNPTVIGELEIGNFAQSVFVSGKYAYVTDAESNDLKIIDISDPDQPSLRSSYIIGDYPYKVYVSGRYAYITDLIDKDLKIVDISNANDPYITSSISVGGGRVHVSGVYAYVASSQAPGMKIIDISDPFAPVIKGSANIGSLPTSIHVLGRYAYVADAIDNDLKIIDVSDPSAPFVIAVEQVGDNLRSVYASGGYAYLIDATSSELKILNVSNPYNPVEVSQYTFASKPSEVFVSGKYAYIVCDSRLVVLNISDANNPLLVSSTMMSIFAPAIYVSGDYAYIVDDGSKLQIVQLTGAEFGTLEAHSLETGNLQVRNDIIAQGQLQVNTGINVGIGGIYSDGDIGLSGNLKVIHPFSETGASGLTIQNASGTPSKKWWRYYVQNGDGDMLLYSSESSANNNVAGEFKSNTGVYNSLSDHRLKKNFEKINGLLPSICALDIFKYHMTSDQDNSQKHYGLIAQDVETDFPELVHYDADSDTYRLEYSTLGVLALQAIKEQQETILIQAAEINEMKVLLTHALRQIDMIQSDKVD